MTSKTEQKILIVEDSKVQALLLKRLLSERGYQCYLAEDGLKGLNAVREYRPDLVVSDIRMPFMDGFALCDAIKKDAQLKTTPVLLLTELSDPKDIIHGLKSGADNYVTKPYDSDLLLAQIYTLLALPPHTNEEKLENFDIIFQGVPYTINTSPRRMLNLLLTTYESAVLKNIELLRTQEVLRDANERLRNMAFYDALTQLPNRRLFSDRLEQTLIQAKRYYRLFAVFAMDLDLFKQVNDQYGHDIGDLLLIEVANRLQNALRTSDTLARIGGDEFIAILPTLSSREDAGIIAQKLIDIVDQPFKIRGCLCKIGLSLGIAIYDPENCPVDISKEDLIKVADQSLYLAKASGRHNYQVYQGDYTTISHQI